MKKFTIICLVLLPLFSLAQEINIKNFKVNETVNTEFFSGTRFDFEFEIQGDYTYGTYGYNQIDLKVYKNSVSSNNLIGLSYWNRENDDDINYPTYTKKNWWFTSLRDYSTYSHDRFYLVVTYAGITKTYVYANPQIDIKNFKVLESFNQSFPARTQFDFEFEIRGDYTQTTHGYNQINLFVYKNSVTAENKVGQIYWNREDDYDIYYEDYYKKQTWFRSYIPYSTAPETKFYLVIEYAGLTKTYTYEIPTSTNGEENFVITDVSFFDGNYNSVQPDQLENYTTYIMKVTCKNDGTGTGKLAAIYAIFASQSKNSYNEMLYSTGAIMEDKKTSGFTDIQPGYSKTYDITVDLPVNVGNLYFGVEAGNNDNKNFVVVPVTVSQYKSATITAIDSNESISSTANQTTAYPNPSNGSFNVKIADKDYLYLRVISTTGQEVYKENIVDKTKTTLQIPNPTSGVYFIELSNEKNKEQIKMIVQ